MCLLFEKYDDDQITEIIKAGDKDNDGFLNYDEFIRMMIDPADDDNENN